MPTSTDGQLPSTFTTKKAQLISAISTPADSYTDKSPKGSIDAPIIDLINQINAIDGLVTTSSCSGRVAVFVEGPKPPPAHPAPDSDNFGVQAATGGPAGKGGGRWLYVSHDPVTIPSPVPPDFFTTLCGFTTTDRPRPATDFPNDSPRLVKLTFSPLILHVLCASLRHAKPLLAAAINAGFRESGVQSLKALEDAEAGTMVGIRTMGLGFETVIGVVEEGEVCRPLVAEEFLAMVFGVVNERFGWNVARRERLRGEIRGHCGVREGWEDKEARRVRKREEGLRRRREKEEMEEKDGLGKRVESDMSVPGAEGLVYNGVDAVQEDFYTKDVLEGVTD